jgi:GMP synthase-like glutamine amidotransferase
MRLLILVNDDAVPPGRLLTEAVQNGHTFELVRLCDGDEIPEPDSFDAVVSLGGEMGAYDVNEFPYLGDEKVFMADMVDQGVPVLGLCLGGQLLAEALGGEAFLADHPEVVFERIELLVEDDPVGAALASGRTVMFHRDTWTLPPGATLIGRSHRFNQAFRFGTAVGVQPHPEVTQSAFLTWATEGRGPEVIRQAGADRDGLIADVSRSEDEMARTAGDFFSAWFAEAEALTTRVDVGDPVEGAGPTEP